MDDVFRCDKKCALERHALKVRDAMIDPTMDHNFVPLCVMKEAGINVSTAPKFKCKIPTLIEYYPACFPRRI